MKTVSGRIKGPLTCPGCKRWSSRVYMVPYREPGTIAYYRCSGCVHEYRQDLITHLWSWEEYEPGERSPHC